MTSPKRARADRLALVPRPTPRKTDGDKLYELANAAPAQYKAVMTLVENALKAVQGKQAS